MPNDIFSRFEAKAPTVSSQVVQEVDHTATKYITEDKVFCFTGSLASLKRADAQAYTRTMLGGIIKNTITSTTDFLVVADDALDTNKLRTAIRKYPHIKIIKEEEFYNMIGHRYVVPA